MAEDSDDAALEFAADILSGVINGSQSKEERFEEGKKTAISKFEEGHPCMFGEIVVRLLGEGEKGSWGDIKGQRMYSVPFVITPHGTKFDIGLLRLTDITDDGMKRLLEYEADVKASGKELYGGFLKNFK